MRERTTWNRTEIQKQASAMSKSAEDPRAMNQDHLQRQPSADKYLTGDPSTFAEDVHPSGQNWKAEYSDGQTARDEIGLPEMRSDSLNHPETDPGSSPARGGGGARQASLDEETLVKKADLCCKVARRMLGPKAVEAAVEDQALALMNLSDPDLIATVNRLAQDQDQDQDQGQKQAQDQEQGQEQEKQAKELPPEFLENIQKKKDEAKEKEDKEASTKLATLEQMAQQVQQLSQQLQQMMAQQQAPVQEAPAQQQEQAQMQQQEPAQMQQVQQAQTMAELQQQQALDAMLQEQSNDQMIDQMLAQGQQQQVQGLDANDFGIQMDSPSMDIGEVGMGPEDEVLSTLFANNQEVQNAQQAHVLQHGAPAPMQVQAAVPQTRTASTRTIGTRPTAGVSQLGGSPTPSAGGDVEKLSNLWNSAPDVSDVFRS